MMDHFLVEKERHSKFVVGVVVVVTKALPLFVVEKHNIQSEL